MKRLFLLLSLVAGAGMFAHPLHAQYFTAARVVPTDGVPSAVVGAGAGTSPSAVTVLGSNYTHTVTLTTGTATTTNAVLATVTFNGALGQAPKSCVLGPNSSGGAANITTVYLPATAITTTTYTINTGATAPAASTSMSWSVICQ